MRAVGVVLPFAGGWFFAEVVRGIEQVLRRHDYDLVLHVLSDEHRRREFFASLPVRRRVDAILVVALELDDAEAEVLRTLGMPMAWVGEPVEDAHGEFVDDVAAARLAVEHLLALGHRRIACVGGNPGRSGPARRRTEGYRQALAAAGLRPQQGWELDGGFTPEGAQTAVLAVLAHRGSVPQPSSAIRTRWPSVPSAPCASSGSIAPATSRWSVSTATRSPPPSASPPWPSPCSSSVGRPLDGWSPTSQTSTARRRTTTRTRM